MDQDQEPKPQRPWYSRQSYVAVAFVGLVSLLLIIGWNNHKPAFAARIHADSRAAQKPLHIILPASHAEENLCKIVLTSSILGYPVPTVVNWNKTYDDIATITGGSHVAKISGALAWLEKMKSEMADDLVVLSDAYDVWFQLPQSVLIDRYYTVLNELDARLASQPGMARVMAERGVHHSVIFTSEKGCSPQRDSEPFCYLQPNSSLPPDLWGNETDTTTGYDYRSSYRKRWLNSGFIIGPASDMLRVFKRAFDVRGHAIGDSDQSVFSVVFAEQQYMREKWRQEAEGIVPKNYSNVDMWAMNALTEDEKRLGVISSTFQPDHDIMNYSLPTSEFGIGIDYWNVMTHGAFASGNDRLFLTYNNTDAPAGLRPTVPGDCNPLVGPTLAADITKTGNPLPIELLRTGAGNENAQQFNWTDIPLYTDWCSGSVPVTIHHNSGKYARWGMWPDLWLHDYAKRALEYYGYLGPGGNYETEGLRPMVHTDTGESLTWTQLDCENWDLSIFGE